jgi:hypothetical protein
MCRSAPWTIRDTRPKIRYSAGVTAEQIRSLVASLPEDSLCFRNVVRSPWPANRRSRREAQVAYALSEPRFGWIVAKTFADQGELVPASVRIPAIRRVTA